jgi:hypothetical protein
VIPLLGIYPKECKTGSKRHLYINVHHSAIHNSQDLETNQVPYNWWMDQENVVLLSHKE